MADSDFASVLYLQHYEVDITSDVVGIDWSPSTAGTGTVAHSVAQARYGTGSLLTTGTPNNIGQINQATATIDLTSPFTIEGSVYVNDTPSNQGIFLQGGATDNDRFQLDMRTGGELAVYAFTGGTQNLFAQTTGAGLVATTWYDIAVTYDGTTLTIFVDGTPLGSGLGFGAYSPSSAVFRWGWARQGGSANSLNGYLDEMRITQVDRYGGLSYTPGPFPDSGDTDPLVITTQPQDTTVNEGDDATFTMIVSGGTGTLRYQWFDDFGGFLPGERSSTLIVPSVANSLNGNLYYATVNDDLNGLLSNDALLTVTPLPGTGPTITSDPQSINVDVGQPANFSVIATGNGTLSYQWYQDGSPVGSNANTYNIASTTALEDADLIYVDVTDLDATVSSQSAVLQVYSATAYPTELPCPTWTYSEQTTAYNRRTPFASGWTRQRIQFPGLGTAVSLEFKMDTVTLAEFDTWAQEFGYTWFEILLEDFSGVQRLREVRLTSAYQYSYNNFDTVLVNVQGEIKND